jgi:hypothetical protein
MPKKTEESATKSNDTGNKTDDGGGGGGNSGGEKEQPQWEVPLKSANTTTIKVLQQNLNKAIATGKERAVPSVPAQLSIDGKLGPKTLDALRFAYAYSSGKKTSDITWDVTTLTLRGVTNLLTTLI